MRTHHSRTATIVTPLLLCLGWPGITHAQWTALTNPPPAFLDTCVLLTDGRVMCHGYSSNAWYLLTPDINGSYANGTWSATATMPNGTDSTAACTPSCTYQPLYFGSAVLADGQVVVVGGEYNPSAVWTPIGFLYDPVADTWSAQLSVPFVTPPGSTRGCIGDAQIIVLDDGTLLLADSRCSRDIAAFNPATLTFTALNPTNKADSNNEENWNILPDGTVLTVDARVASQFEIYDPVTNNWTSGNTPVNLADTGTNTSSAEVGPGVLRPDGTLIYFSGNWTGQNALYDTATNTWSNTAAMDFPQVPGQSYAYSVADGPASLLPNGNVLVMASPVTNLACGNPAPPPPPPTCGVFNTPSQFYEFDYGTNTLVSVAASPNAASFISYQGRMLLLPTGEVLLTAYDQNVTQDVMLYSNGGVPEDEWRPVITSCLGPIEPGGTYSISGTLFNGFSEGATYGDDAAMSTNYPLVRITNIGTGHVFYARTHDHSRMGVQLVGSTEIVTTQFDAPAGLEPGASELVVVVNGIASDPPVIINDNHPPTCDAAGPYIAECEGVTTSIQLDGTASSDPDPDDILSFSWSTDCPGGSFDDDTSATPVLTVDSVGPCPLECTVTLTVTDCSDVSAVCDADVAVDDTKAPVIMCPDDATVTCGESTEPEDLGMATATDDCDPVPEIDYFDVTTPTTCPADPVQEVIERTWAARDACENETTCVQTITVLKQVHALDIQPGSCPNGFNPKSKGVLPVSLLGTPTFDVSTVDVSTVQISLAGGTDADCLGSPASPTQFVFEDAGTPFEGMACDCHALLGDGVTDLSFKFDMVDVVTALELAGIEKGESVEIVLSGVLEDGCSFIASDCVTRPGG